MNDGFDVAQICINGHVINPKAQSRPDSNQLFCEKCGEESMVECLNCDEPLRGLCCTLDGNGIPYERPAYCHNCGAPFPWTERAISAAIEAARDSGALNREEQVHFRDSIEEIAKDTPNAELAGLRLAKLISMMTKAVGDAVRALVVDIASESVKKAICDN